MHQVGHVGFAIAVIADVQVEHELRESAVQPRQVSRQHDEPRSGHAPGSLKIHAAPLAERDMILGREVELPRNAPPAHFHVGRLVLSVGDARVQDIGQSQLQTRHLGLNDFELLFDSLQLLAQGFACGEQGSRVLALGFGVAHGFGIGIALGAQPIGCYLYGFALLFQCGEGRDVEHKAAPRQCRGNPGQIAAQQLRIEHDGFLDLKRV